MTAKDHAFYLSVKWRLTIILPFYRKWEGVYCADARPALKWSKSFTFILTPLDAGCCPLNRKSVKKGLSILSPLYRMGKNILSVSADFNQKEEWHNGKSQMEKKMCVMRREECSKIYWKILLCVNIFVLPRVSIRGVWEQTLILVTFCIWPWRCLSLSLSEAAFFFLMA